MMQTQTKNLKTLDAIKSTHKSDDIFHPSLNSWRERLGFCSLVAAVPAVLASAVPATSSAEDESAKVTIPGHTPRPSEKFQLTKSKRALLKRQSEFRMPHQNSFAPALTVAGADDCPGASIPGGTYTVASPLTIMGDTTGANNTVNALAGYYYFYGAYSASGPDNVYSFTLSSVGPNAQIEVTTSSGTYKPLVYLLDGRSGAASCPAGTGNFQSNWFTIRDSRWTQGSQTAITDVSDPWYVNRPFYLFVDSAYDDGAGSGPYTIRMRDLTVAPTPGCNQANPIDCQEFFVRQQYVDFLAREPEPSCAPNQCGLDFYLPIMNGCGDNIECVHYTRGALSANFFRSPEFQARGGYVANLYNITLGQRAKTVAELSDAAKVERPHYTEFIADLTSLTAPTEAESNAKKDQLAAVFLQRSEIQAILPGSLTNQQFVQKLESVAGVTLANESALVSNLNGGASRASVLRAVGESPEVITRFYIQNFVTMEYFGYLRRDPEDCHATLDPTNCGYIFHNSRFNTAGADPDLIENIIVRGFIESPEYRHRFGP